MERKQISLTYAWLPVFLREKVEYLFPMAITPFMRSKYKVPAVFRWEIYQNKPGDKKLVYIGEAQELCPQRLYSCLNPSSTQLAARKINLQFRDYLKEKLNIKLDICQVTAFQFADRDLGGDALLDKYLRRLLVAAMIVDHRQNAYTVMDL